MILYQIPVYAHVHIHAQPYFFCIAMYWIPAHVQAHACRHTHTSLHFAHAHTCTYACTHAHTTQHSVVFTCYILQYRSLTLNFNKKCISMLELLWFENRFVVQKWWSVVLYLGKMTEYNLKKKEPSAILTLETSAWVRHVLITAHFKVTLHVSHLYNVIKSPKNVTT